MVPLRLQPYLPESDYSMSLVHDRTAVTVRKDLQAAALPLQIRFTEIASLAKSATDHCHCFISKRDDDYSLHINWLLVRRTSLDFKENDVHMEFNGM